ncbi:MULTISPECIES: hypothetical protein [Paracoccaceae]|uniref:hypothetical protein n=1 Tax=Paracoccaceae TaxID=31989 RepID=UPI003296AA52
MQPLNWYLVQYGRTKDRALLVEPLEPQKAAADAALSHAFKQLFANAMQIVHVVIPKFTSLAPRSFNTIISGVDPDVRAAKGNQQPSAKELATLAECKFNVEGIVACFISKRFTYLPKLVRDVAAI